MDEDDGSLAAIVGGGEVESATVGVVGRRQEAAEAE